MMCLIIAWPDHAQNVPKCERSNLQNPRICWNAITLLHVDNITWHKLCGVELIIGPYSCMLGPVLYAVFGTCIHSSIGTGALICLLVGEHVPARD